MYAFAYTRSCMLYKLVYKCFPYTHIYMADSAALTDYSQMNRKELEKVCPSVYSPSHVLSGDKGWNNKEGAERLSGVMLCLGPASFRNCEGAGYLWRHDTWSDRQSRECWHLCKGCLVNTHLCLAADCWPTLTLSKKETKIISNKVPCYNPVTYRPVTEAYSQKNCMTRWTNERNVNSVNEVITWVWLTVRGIPRLCVSSSLGDDCTHQHSESSSKT